MIASILDRIPEPAQKRIAIRVHAGAEHALRQNHPWVFDQAIQTQSHTGQSGDLAVIFDQRRKFLAIGLFDPHSPIRVRILQHHTPAQIDGAWYRERLVAAAARRSALPADTDGYRLVHGENDGLPGMVVDRYAGILVLRLDTTAWIPHLRVFLPVLQKLLAPKAIILRLARSVANQPKLLFDLEDGQLLAGKPTGPRPQFRENGLIFEVDPVRGQKTGFFLDQRENRARVETLAHNRRVLNVFAYTAGFSLYAARGGAQAVDSVDLSQPALDGARRNFRLNREDARILACQHRIICADAFDFLQQTANRGQTYDLVILDPPSFARRQEEIERALQAYRRLTRLGLQVLAPAGILVQSSCSSRITAETFFDTIHQAAKAVNRPLQELERSDHGLDHPVSFPEGAYLKCLFAKG